MKLTPAENAAVDAMQRHGTVKAAAHALGKSPWTVIRQLESARRRLDVGTTIEATRFRDIA